ncbi:head decoration protein [Novosphingobium mangrovi (ex Huang et al. 2023)]|uniref:Head decoration protein n=1 Tax=Novosphingobium mangrovi (ex Huang et al. 2023) TaxID=2976432 RepID=A0ABT2I136_9SPHN|nr:head decoration protein [Novosphingobium mangrovi (ex Huang et al. 2023)]MCT2398521.1 head decoration protein [Novosphingobium mangrovi (ex Huang et al. 2023)]
MYDSASYSAETPFAPSQILAGGSYTTRVVTIISGQNLEAGAVLGKITASSKYNLSLSAAADGSETPDLILLQDADASGGDIEALALETGQVNADALTVGTGHTIASIREGLRGKGITIDD